MAKSWANLLVFWLANTQSLDGFFGWVQSPTTLWLRGSWPRHPGKKYAYGGCSARCFLYRRTLHPAVSLLKHHRSHTRLSKQRLLISIFTDNGRGILPRKCLHLLFSVLLLNCMELYSLFRTLIGNICDWLRAIHSETLWSGLRLSTDDNLGFRHESCFNWAFSGFNPSLQKCMLITL